VGSKIFGELTPALDEMGAELRTCELMKGSADLDWSRGARDLV